MANKWIIKTKQDRKKKDHRSFLINLVCTKIDEITKSSISDSPFEIARKVREYLSGLSFTGCIYSYEVELDRHQYPIDHIYLYCSVRLNERAESLRFRTILR